MPSLSRPELLEVLKDAGFADVKLFYPFPDHLLPQIIFTDEYPPGEELVERLCAYSVNNVSLVIDANKLYRPLSSGGMITFFANSFLAECGNGDLSRVLYSAVSTERHREESFSTVIYSDKSVEKIPIYKEGAAGLKRLAQNLKSLNQEAFRCFPAVLRILSS
jgi:hypothetical protein